MLHHIELYVSNLDETCSFWGWLFPILGFEHTHSWETGATWTSGGVYFSFVAVKQEYRTIEYHRCGVGLNHLAFSLPSNTDVDRLVTELKQRQIDLLYEQKHPSHEADYYAVFFEDPDRIKVEVVSTGG